MSLQAAVDRLGRAVHNVSVSESNGESKLTVATEKSGQSRLDGSYFSDKTRRSYIFEFLDELIETELRDVLVIAASLTMESDSSNSNLNVVPTKMLPNPIAPPTVLSINHLRIVYTSIELLWVCGVQPTLEGVLTNSFNWGEAPHPKSLLISKEVICSLSKKDDIILDNSKILLYCQCIYSLISNSLFSANMLPRNLKRVLIALLVLSRRSAVSTDQVDSENEVTGTSCFIDIYGPAVPPDLSRNQAEKLLNDICFNKKYKMLVISELRIATRGPQWMRTVASDLFSRVILSDLGLEAVLRAYLEGAELSDF